MEKNSPLPIWNGTANTAWYSESETEFTISTAEQLAGLSKLVNGGNDFKDKTIKLGQNIALNDTEHLQDWATKPPANEWLPIGIMFNGTFDGCGFAISGVYINNSSTGQGLFGCIDAKGAIKKLGVVASYIKGGRAVGGLAYSNNGKISNSYFNGTVIGEIIVGGLVGLNARIISDSHSAGIVEGKSQVGGLAGIMIYAAISEISNSFSTSKVTGKEFVGELVGRDL
jgi:hypothetical protein